MLLGYRPVVNRQRMTATIVVIFKINGAVRDSPGYKY